MVKPTLLVLAAGMGSRYGSLKQMDGVGPNNEAIIDYSIYDAIRAGFGKVVFVIRHAFEKEFREVFSKERFGGKIEVEFVFQELDYLPEGCSVPEGRVKPWGTNHAVLMAKDVVKEPFAVINADDFYGAEAYQTIGDYLSQLDNSTDLYNALSILSATERTCITLHYMEDISVADICDIVGLPTGTVKSHLSRGRTKLSKFLKQNGYE
jgi:RNA polymerase sigma factor (sigma-70 family)